MVHINRHETQFDRLPFFLFENQNLGIEFRLEIGEVIFIRLLFVYLIVFNQFWSSGAHQNNIHFRL